MRITILHDGRSFNSLVILYIVSLQRALYTKSVLFESPTVTDIMYTTQHSNYNANWNMPQHNVCNYLHSYVCQSSNISYCCVSQSMMVAPCRYIVHLWLAFVALWLAYNQPITNPQSQATMDWLARYWSCMEHIEHFRLILLWMLSWHMHTAV